MIDPRRSIRFERLDTCPVCKELIAKKIQTRHSPYFCLAAILASFIADEPVGVQGSKIPNKVIEMIGKLNVKRIFAGLDPFLIEDDDSNFYTHDMSSDPGFHD